MKPTKANFCTPIRNALANAGYSYVKALNVCNSVLGQMTEKSTEGKTGNITVNLKKDEAKATVIENTKFVGVASDSPAYLFAAFNDAVAKAEKLCPSMTVTLGETFTPWLDKVAMPDKKETEKEMQKA